MAETIELAATARDGVGKGAARAARREGLVPGVIYGGNADPQTISVKFNELLKLLKAGKFMSTLLNVKVDGADNRVICRAVQRDVVKDLPTHIDFLRLSERSRINLFIPVSFENEETCPGIKKGGVLTVVRHTVEMTVPADSIPEALELDLANAEPGDSLHISAITIPEGCQPTITDRDFTVATITAPSAVRSSAGGASDEEGDAEAAPAEGGDSE